MKRRLVPALVAAIVLGFGLTAFPFGIEGGIELYTLDLSEAFGKVGQVIDAAGSALGLAQADIDNLISTVEGTLPDLTVIPFPLLGGAIEIGLPLPVIDSVKISGGILTDRLIREIASSLGSPIPQPLIDQTFDFGTETGTLRADLSFSSYMLKAEVRKRLDLWIGAADLGLGATWIAGELSPLVDLQAPPGYESSVAAALNALHLDGLFWSTFGFNLSVGIEVGPPFLRVRAEGNLLLIVGGENGWWGITPSGITASIGLVIRF